MWTTAPCSHSDFSAEGSQGDQWGIFLQIPPWRTLQSVLFLAETDRKVLLGSVLESAVAFKCPAALWCLVAALVKQVKFTNPVWLQTPCQSVANNKHSQQHNLQCSCEPGVRLVVSGLKVVDKSFSQLWQARPFLTMSDFSWEVRLENGFDNKSATKPIFFPFLQPLWVDKTAINTTISLLVQLATDAVGQLWLVHSLTVQSKGVNTLTFTHAC